jgi:HD-GYP domain-containing protein (c-di-GMP phosphodiesterase class II)
MLRNMYVKDLKPGMRVVDPGIDGRTRPYLYASERFIDSEDTVRQILAQGYREAYVDLALSDAKIARRYGLAADCLSVPSASLMPAVHAGPRRTDGRRTALREELPHAVRLHDEAVDCTRRLMYAASRGSLDIGMAEDLANRLADSLERNPDALLCLSFLRRHAPYFCTHCVNVAVLLAAFALGGGSGRSLVTAYGLAGLLYDLGKAMLPVSLLSARRKLTAEEESLMRRHPVLAWELLSSSAGVGPEVLKAALEHHERHDGSGYPHGLSGDAISETGQITGIADSYDALTGNRPFKRAVPPHKALAVLYQMRGNAFQSRLLEAFVRMLGIYPTGSVVELQDGYRGVVSAVNPDNPTKPSVILVLDPQGRPMRLHEFDLATDVVAGISRCLPEELSGIDPAAVLGVNL